MKYYPIGSHYHMTLFVGVAELVPVPAIMRMMNKCDEQVNVI